MIRYQRSFQASAKYIATLDELVWRIWIAALRKPIMSRITPIPTTRVSDSLAQQRLLHQLQSDQVDVLRLQQQISTGRRIQVLSEDAPAGLRGVALQRLLEQKTQIENNLQTNQSFLSDTDRALRTSRALLARSKGRRARRHRRVATPVQREAIAQEIDGTLEQAAHHGQRKLPRPLSSSPARAPTKCRLRRRQLHPLQRQREPTADLRRFRLPFRHQRDRQRSLRRNLRPRRRHGRSQPRS